MKEVYQQTKRELFDKYGSAAGHTEENAKELLQKFGENALEEKGKKSVFRVFLEQFADLLVIILIAAAVISMFSGNVESTIVIFAVIILNAILGTVQYVKAEKSLDSLKELSAPKAKVLRDGVRKEVASKEIVPGDVLLLEAGDLIVADGRIIENYSLQVNESSLTGESTNVDKKDEEIENEAALGDRYNMVFSGSLVTYGRANVLVTSTGMNTEMGKIATLMNDTKDKKTPLQVSLDDFSKKLAMLIMMISVIVFGLRIWQQEPVLDSLMFAVALAVAAIPEALSSIVTIVQAMGTRKMAADNAIIKDLKAVESLGCVSVICSDKTGTLTQNKMTVKEVYIDDKCMQPEQLDLASGLHRYFLYIAILNNDSTINDGKDIGDPTETCLLNMARKAGLMEAGVTEEDIRCMMPRIEEIPFDSDRKIMSTKYRVHGVPTVFTKGAVDVLLDRIENIATSEGVRPITEEDKEKIVRQNQIFSENGLRVLAFAYKECEENDTLSIENEYGYTFTGLVSMIDPPREESIEAVADAISAGIKPVMITGDHKVTATAIARQIGIFHDGDMAVTGQELDKMTDDELDLVLENISVYARVSPENKIRIVNAWQRKGNIVAMTGDGVNDAPALKKADIGVAMGITGTEVSKDASAMILADDNFATIIKAVLNGRNVYRNIMNAIQFLLSGNMAAILVVLFCSVMALDTPFEPVHLLFINLLTDSLPALAIGMEPSDKQLLKNKPRNPKAGMLTKEFSLRLLGYGLLIAIVTQAAYYLGLEVSPMTASTMAFATLTLARLFHGFTCRSEFSIVKIKLTSNMWSVAAFCTGVFLLGFVLLAPFMHSLFMVEALSLANMGWIVLLAFIPTACIQLARVVREQFRK
ncbi:MAG: cation-translocating P-type ATPase [Lachnospiraceae bacterium]